MISNASAPNTSRPADGGGLSLRHARRAGRAAARCRSAPRRIGSIAGPRRARRSGLRGRPDAGEKARGPFRSAVRPAASRTAARRRRDREHFQDRPGAGSRSTRSRPSSARPTSPGASRRAPSAVLLPGVLRVEAWTVSASDSRIGFVKSSPADRISRLQTGFRFGSTFRPNRRSRTRTNQRRPTPSRVPLRTSRRAVAGAIKRGLDIAGSAALLVLLSPLFLLIAALVKLKSRGPVIYEQTRVGQNMKPFTMLKFRTMHLDADHALHREFVSAFINSRAAGAEHGAIPLLQADRRPAGHADRTPPAQDEPRRAAAALERAARRHVARRAAPGAPVRARAVQALAPPPRARGQTGSHRPVAGHRAQPHDVRRDGAARPPVRQDVLASGPTSRSSSRRRRAVISGRGAC